MLPSVLLDAASSKVGPLLLTYMLHSVLWTAVLCLAQVCLRGSAALRNTLWKLALLGPCATALLPSEVYSWFAQEASADVKLSFALSAGSARDETTFLDGALTVALGLGMLRFVVLLTALRRRLERRVPARDPRLLAQVERLRARLCLPKLVLTESAEFRVPMVIGLRELCVPSTSLRSLSDHELAAVLAHELAHIERRDGLWFPLAAFLQSLLWIQPLNHIIVKRLRDSAELACDDRAVELTGEPRWLARALVHVAQRAARLEQVVLPASAHAARPLSLRVQRLLAAEPTTAQPRALGHQRVLVGLVACVVTVLCLRVRAVPTAAPPEERAKATDHAALQLQLEALLQRDEQLQRRFERSQTPELEQELRHVRAAAAWTEQRLVRRASP